MRRYTVLPLLLAVLAGCRPAQEPAPKTYEVRGQVLAVRRDIREIRVDHEEIPGYMAAMTMSFAVEDEKLLSGLERGDLVRATLNVTDTDAWLSTIEKVGHAAIAERPPDVSSPPTAPLELLEPGQPVPDETFTDQEGRAFAFAGTRGRAVALTFIYTRCPLPNFCPRMDRNFLQAQRLVEARAELRGKVQFVSVSIDPGYDTPAIMKQHAASIGADLSSWRFLVAEPARVDRFAGRFGVSIVRESGDSLDITHNLRTAVIGPDGRLVRVLPGADWTPEELVRELVASLTT
jgi:protein SCO1/2